MSLTVNDTAPAFTATCSHTDPVTKVVSAVDLTGSQAKVTFVRRMDRSTLGPVTATLADAVNGKVSYAWQPTDVSVPGEWDAWVKVTYADGTVETFGPASMPVNPLPG